MSDPEYKAYRELGVKGIKFLSCIKKDWVNKSIKHVAGLSGDPEAAIAASHGFRRGAACDMALAGCELKVILGGGDWRSQAFRDYIRSVQNDLAGRALMQLMGDVSDSDDEA